jgi:hypothetical protein
LRSERCCAIRLVDHCSDEYDKCTAVDDERARDGVVVDDTCHDDDHRAGA